MAEYDQGETVTLEAIFPAPPSTVSLMVSKPDGSIVSPTPNIDITEAPTYRANVLGDMVGTWGYRFEGTGLVTGIEEGYFVVIASAVLAGVPAYTYDLATQVGQVRLLIDDRDLSNVANATPLRERSAIFSDAELTTFLNAASNNVYIAAARALTAMAGNRAFLIQSRRIGRTDVSLGSLKADYLRQAEVLTQQAYSDEPGTAFAEIAWNDFSARRIINNAALRELS